MLEGLPPHNPTRVMRIATDEASARAMTELIGEIFDPAETVVAAFATPTGQWLLEAYFARDPDEAAVRDLIRPLVGPRADRAAFAAISPTDWVKASLAGLKPVRVRRFLIHGSHDAASVSTHHIGIRIDAALAFGTGHHGSTLGCLEALDNELKRRRPRAVLDVGTGTGILAIAAAKALKRPVVAGDVDPVAVTVARNNARANGVARNVRFYAAPGARHLLAQRRRHFDLVLANILANPLKRLAPSLRAVLQPGGVIVLSGLLMRDAAGVLSAYAAQGLRLQRRIDHEGWATLIVRNGGAPPRRRARSA
jgi:ribosomal protein L11 methyltransferase